MQIFLYRHLKMNNFISKETAEELRKMGCNVPATPTYDLGEIVTNFELAKVFFGERKVCKNSGEGVNYHGSCGECTLVQCLDIVPEYFFRTTEIKNYLLKNEKEEAEKHLLKYCVFTH